MPAALRQTKKLVPEEGIVKKVTSPLSLLVIFVVMLAAIVYLGVCVGNLQSQVEQHDVALYGAQGHEVQIRYIETELFGEGFPYPPDPGSYNSDPYSRHSVYSDLGILNAFGGVDSWQHWLMDETPVLYWKFTYQAEQLIRSLEGSSDDDWALGLWPGDHVAQLQQMIQLGLEPEKVAEAAKLSLRIAELLGIKNDDAIDQIQLLANPPTSK